MPVVLAVALGGAVGASARYGADKLISTHSTFPWSTFVVNIVGCFLIGICSNELADSPDWVRSGVIVGAIGGFTTFSTFAYQALENHAALAAVYVAASVAIGIAAVAAGRALT
jgi:CrcB protein